jgi:hypothetical protein
MKLIKKYQKVLTTINKNIFFPTPIHSNKKPPIYQTNQNLTQSSLLNEKRSGMKLDPDMINEVAIEHTVTKQIINIT